jgi:hypothetical protein
MLAHQSRRLQLLTAALILAAGSGILLAAPGGSGRGKGPPEGTPPGFTPPVNIQAPEIDAAAGVQGIALLSGVLLLVAERRRRQRG